MPRNIITSIGLARGVALVRKGANQESHVLLRKTGEVDPLQQSSSEDPAMSIKNLQKIALMNEGSRLHFATITDEAAATVFLEKTAEEQTVEVEKAAYDKLSPDEKKKKDAEMKKAAGGGDESVDLSKSTFTLAELMKASTDAVTAAIAPIAARVEEMSKAAVELDLEKAAGGAEYKGYPGGTVEVIKALRAITGQPEEVRTVVIDSMKTRAEAARSYLGHAGEHSAVDMTKGANGQIEAKAAELVKADPKLSIENARAQVVADPANGALLLKALEEEDHAAAA